MSIVQRRLQQQRPQSIWPWPITPKHRVGAAGRRQRRLFGGHNLFQRRLRAAGPVAGDFNRDGNLDLAVANYGSNKIGLLLGNGQGGFAAPATFATGGNDPLARGCDFNHDGKLDLAVAKPLPSSNNVGMLLGDGHGRFATATTYGTGSKGANIRAVGDFNGDGNLDMAVGNNGSTIGILLGNGSGGFGTATTLSTGSDLLDTVVAADLNGDGRPDLIVGGDLDACVGVFLNNGSGGFGSIKTYYCGGDSQSVVAGDFNGDGKIDLAVANSSGAGGVGVLLGNGTGGFATATLYPDTGLCIAAGDFNGDGIPDLAVALDGLPYMGVLLGVGNGSFATTTTIACGRTITYSMAAADFNGDGKTDLAAATGSGVAVLLATASGGLGSPTTYATASGQSNFVVVGDFNGDGIPDLAVDVHNGSASGVAVLLGNGSGGFGNATFYLTGNPSADSLTTSLAVADFNNDGKPDLAEIGSNGVSVLLNNGAGAFGSRRRTPPAGRTRSRLRWETSTVTAMPISP